MRILPCILLLHLFINCKAQSDEQMKFYGYYSVSESDKKSCDSIFRLIETRRSLFSESYRAYGSKNKSHLGFKYDWLPLAQEIEESLSDPMNKPVKDLVYYSYFDISYGAYGYVLNQKVAKRAILELGTRTIIWTLEPSLLLPVIEAIGGEDKNRDFINQLLINSPSESFSNYIKANLGADRILKRGNILPIEQYIDLNDTLKIKSTNSFRGKYLLIDVWATWCKPCIEELPNLCNAYSYARKGDNLEFLSISVDSHLEVVQRFIAQFQCFSWEVGLSPDKNILRSLQVNGIPLTILIDPNGKILDYGNDLRGEKLLETLDRLVH